MYVSPPACAGANSTGIFLLEADLIQWQTLRRRLLIGLGLGVLIFLVLAIWGGLEEVGQTLRQLRWAFIPLILGFTALNYVLRWAKWHYYLHHLGLHDIGLWDSVLLFVAGMTMAVTPGKIGEVFKSYLLKRLNGTPMSVSAPIVVAERLTDGLGMLLIAGVGLSRYRYGLPAFALLLAGAATFIAVVQIRPLTMALLNWSEGIPLGRRFSAPLRSLYESSYQLLRWRPLLLMTLLSALSWFGECVAFYYVLRSLGVPGGGDLLLQASFIFAASTLLGLVSFLPGGLGVAEASYAGLLDTLGTFAHLSPQAATAAAASAAFLIRLCTLWFGVGLGAVALFWLGRRLGGLEETDSTNE
ncbi:MAG: flippase-like domain-containing protein [Chloroflexia bacterium]|nr:flippase-like domain-containing protein [Chloroflexia bacterium]